MTFAVTEPSGFASKWLPLQTANVSLQTNTALKNPAKMFALNDWTQIAVARSSRDAICGKTSGCPNPGCCSSIFKVFKLILNFTVWVTVEVRDSIISNLKTQNVRFPRYWGLGTRSMMVTPVLDGKDRSGKGKLQLWQSRGGRFLQMYSLYTWQKWPPVLGWSRVDDK